MFTLTDPRLQAWSHAGQGIGGALGNSLAKYIENKRIQEAQGKITPEMPLSEQLKIYSKAGVSPASQERLLSPTMIQQQNLERGRNALEKIDFSNVTPENLPKKLLEVSKALIGTGLEKSAGDILNTYAAYARGKNYGDLRSDNGDLNSVISTLTGAQGLSQPSESDQEKGITRPTRKNATATKPGNLPQDTQQPNSLGEATQPPGEDNRTIPQLNVPVTGPLSGDQQQELWDKAWQATGNEEMANSFVDRYTKANETERNAQLQEINRLETQRNALREEELKTANEIKPYVEEKYKKNGIELPQYMKAWLNKMVRESKGPIEERFQTASERIDSALNRISFLKNAPKRPWGGALRDKDYKSYLKRKKLAVDQALYRSRLVPSFIKRDFMEDIKGELIADGDGLVDAEYMLNSPTPENAKKIDSAGKNKAPKKITTEVETFALPGYPSRKQTLTTKIPITIEKDQEKNIEKLADIAFDLAGGYTSPLIVRNRWLDLGYTDAQIIQAYQLADERGAPFSDYQRDQIAQLIIPERPSFNSMSSGEKTLRGIWDIFISGRK